ncbi:ferrochelatase [Flocculibacter collagenilyticus]|uniref:ferrochelatase n=1 Tax=Flocculibacter collagenilyticus TaxID=2744479 RepID=UPI0018F36904|nr:ferrochelatase [Flocculibacter collagenilyticus]
MSKFSAVTDNPHKRFNHKTGVLLTNLGSPDAPTTSAVRTYLREFLSDRRIVEIPRVVWLSILHGVILRTRPARSAKLYKEIWTENGSPLVHITRQQADKLSTKLQAQGYHDVEVVMAMRYGNPSIASGLKALREKGLTRIIIMPMYPQYSGTTTGSTFDAVAKELSTWRWVPELHFVNGYHQQPAFVNALVSSIKEHFGQHGKPQKLLFSYHGIPRRFLDQGDPYYCFCMQTTRLVIEQLGLDEADYITCFQSRLGKAEWLKPYTDKTLAALPSEGITDVAIISPAFSADCLETLEELEQENRETFMEAGGTRYQYIPALNDRDDHINAIFETIKPML